MNREGRGKQRRWDRWALACIAIAMLVRIPLLTLRLYDPDEFEHLHASYSIAQRLTPYRDFFEHHGPLPYYLFAPMVRWLGPTPTLLTVQRIYSLVFVLLMLVSVHRLARRMYGPVAGLIAVFWMSCLPSFVEKSVEWRPDVPAALFLIWCVSALVGGNSKKKLGLPPPAYKEGTELGLPPPAYGKNSEPSPPAYGQPLRRGLIAGLWFGLALLCTQKAVVLAPGLVVGVWVVEGARSCSSWKAVDKRRSKASIRNRLGMLAAGALGALIPWLAAVLWFWSQGALEEFLRCVFYYPWIWSTREPWHDYLLSPLQWAPWQQATLGLALAHGAYRLFFVRQLRRGEPILWWASISHLAGATALPAVYLQYYLLAASLWGVLVGGELARWRSLSRRHVGARPTGYLGWLPLAICIGWTAFGLWWERNVLTFGWRQLTEILSGGFRGPISPYPLIDLAAVALLAVGVVILLFARRTGRLVLWLALLTPSVGRCLAPIWYWRVEPQWADLELVHRLTPADHPVLDGFTGFGCLRPHAIYWWWLNHHSLPLMTKLGDQPMIEDAIRQGKPALILFDPEFKPLAERLEPLIRQKYRPAAQQPKSVRAVFLLRNDLPDPTATQ